MARTFRSKHLRIAIVSTCDYSEDNKLYGIHQISLKNREAYSQLHGYSNEFFITRDDPQRHPVWSAISRPLRLLEKGDFDWVVSLDCDSLLVDMETTIEHMLYAVAGVPGSNPPRLDDDVHFLISEDGRGLAGGNWMAKNSQWTISFLQSVLGTNDPLQHPYNRHDLRDQFSLLWHLVRPSATNFEAVAPAGHVRATDWRYLEYLEKTRIIPQRLINAYPWALCRPEHHCFEDGKDFIVSFITLGSLSREMGFAMLENFLNQSLSSYQKIRKW